MPRGYPGTLSPHGTPARYQGPDDCRCDRCRNSWTLYERARVGRMSWEQYNAARATYRESTLRCHRCGDWKADDMFSTASKNRARRGRTRECKTCDAMRKREWRAVNRSEYNSRERLRKRQSGGAV